MAIRFEKVSRFADADFNLPVRKTKNSAGYDFEVAEDILIPSFYQHFSTMLANIDPAHPNTLAEFAKFTKEFKVKPTLVSTGVKCYLEEGYYLELSVRSSTPLKYWLILANSVGIIDADYADNEDNEGEIFFQIINLSPAPVQLHKGDIIGQGIIKKYEIVDNDDAEGERTGGFGSTTKQKPQKKGITVDINMNEDIQKAIEKAILDEFEKAIFKNATFEPNYNAMTMAIEPNNYDGRGMRAKAGIIDEVLYSPSKEAILKEVEKSLQKGGMGI